MSLSIGCGLPAQEVLQVAGDPLSLGLVSNHTLELCQTAVHQLEAATTEQPSAPDTWQLASDTLHLVPDTESMLQQDTMSTSPIPIPHLYFTCTSTIPHLFSLYLTCVSPVPYQFSVCTCMTSIAKGLKQ